MGIFDLLFGRRKDPGRDMDELARRLGLPVDQLTAVRPSYREFSIAKCSGGTRRIAAPGTELKHVQRRIYRRLLARLPVHPAATAFRPGLSIVANAIGHAGRAVVVRMDLKEFFPSIRAERVAEYFSAIGWNRETVGVLVKLCTHDGALPQGAPTSPVLSNVVNYRLDARLSAIAGQSGAVYTRYADDLTFSFAAEGRAGTALAGAVRGLIRTVKNVLREEGYRINHRKKVRIRRRHQRQEVTGLVVNERVRLPRETRRWLRAVKHRIETGKRTTLTEQQLAGWLAFEAMLHAQTGA